jgi:hypothetical protein
VGDICTQHPDNRRLVRDESIGKKVGRTGMSVTGISVISFMFSKM